MADPDTSGHEPEWYERQWEELMDLFPTSDPEEIVDRLQDIRDVVDTAPSTDLVDAIESLNDRADALDEERKAFREAGFERPARALKAIESMEQQLQELYAERERRAEFNLNDTDDALAMLKNMQQQLEVLYERQEEMSDQGIDGMDHALSVIESMNAQLNEVYEERNQTASAPSLSADDPLLSEDSLARLDDLPPDDLDALPAGVFRLTDRGIVQDANAKALRWPGADDNSPDALVGAHFFREVAPGTDNDLFRGRFEKGIDRGKMDEQFLYTYVSARATATNLAVHLHRTSDQSANWIVFRVLEQY